MVLRCPSPAGSFPPALDRNERSFEMPMTPIPRSLTKSTPRALTVKPPPLKSRARNQTEDDISVQPLSQPDDQIIDTSDDPFLIPAAEPRKESQCPRSHLENLPPEILESIVGHVVGHLGSISSDASNAQNSVRNWNAIMRHPRRKKVADLALVSYTWRRLIQERVYRHIKIQGTRTALQECGEWFMKNPHLQGYVRHFEVLVPIWEMKPGRLHPHFTIERHPGVQGHTFVRAFQGLAINDTSFTAPIQEATTAFQLASKNATMDEIFGCAKVLFPGLCALTIEGGHCKRPPKVQYFREEVNKPLIDLDQIFNQPDSEDTFESKILSLSMPVFRHASYRARLSPAVSSRPYFPPPSPPNTTPRLPVLINTKTLILKGAWNLVRSASDFKTLAAALPSLKEFHCTYHKPKTDAYIAMYEALEPYPPLTITHLNLCLEGLYTKNASSIKKWRKLYPARHICRALGKVSPRLESMTYTGRVCSTLFKTAVDAAQSEIHRVSGTRLKSIDIVVNNVCRDPNSYNDGTGIHNWAFIQSFESLVLEAVRSLTIYDSVKNIRIRFIDLDSPAPLMNPMFHLEGNQAWGIYSDAILRALMDVRPEVAFDLPLGTDSETTKRCSHMGKHRSTSVNYYKAIAHAGGQV